MTEGTGNICNDGRCSKSRLSRWMIVNTFISNVWVGQSALNDELREKENIFVARFYCIYRGL